MTDKNDLLAGTSMPDLGGANGPNASHRIVEAKVGPQQFKHGPKVLVCLPSGRTWEARTATAVAGLCTFSALHGIQISIANLEGSMISKQRNDLVKMALDNGFDYMLSVDTDMIMPPDALIKLLKHEKDVVGATYNKRVPPYETLGKLKGPVLPMEELVKGGLREAELMPGGFMLVKMDVYRRLGWPYYWETYQWYGETGVDALKTYLRNSYVETPPEAVLDELDATPKLTEWLNSMFTPKSEPRWEYFSEDLNFCRKLRKNGIKLYCDMDLTFQMIHLGTLEVTCKPPEQSKPQTTVPAVIPAEM